MVRRSYSLLPRETAVSPRRRTGEKGQKTSHFSRFSLSQERPLRTDKVMTHWPLWRRNDGSGCREGGFLVRGRMAKGEVLGAEKKGKRQK